MSNATLLYGPSFRDLRDEAFSRADSLGENGTERVLFFEQNAYQQEAIADAWAAEYQPLRLTVSDLSSFASRAHERLFGPYPGIGTFERRRVIEQALDAIDDAGLITDARQHVDAFSELFRELEADNLLTPTAVRARLEECALSAKYVEPVAKAYGEYVEIRSEFVHPDAIPQNQKVAEVATADRSLAEILPTVDVVIVSNLLDPAAVEEQLLRRLADEFHVLYLLPQTAQGAQPTGPSEAVRETRATLEAARFEAAYVEPSADQPLSELANAMFTADTVDTAIDQALSWHRAPTPDREVRHVARQLRKDLAETGHHPDDILVLAPGLLSYREQIADSFDSYGIEYAMNLGVFLEHTYAGRAVLDAVQLCEQPSADSLAALASNPTVELPDVDSAELSDLARRLYTSDIERYRGKLSTSIDGVDDLLATTANVQEASSDAIVSQFRTLLDRLGIGDPERLSIAGSEADAAYEKRAVRRVQKSLDSVERVCVTRAPDNPFREIASALEGVRIPAPRQDPSNRIEVIGLQDTPMAEFARLYVLGATANHLPNRDDRARFFRRIGDELELLPEHRTRDKARYRFAILLANAESVHISTPERTTDDEQLLESPLLDELARLTGLEPTDGIETESRGSTEDLQRAMGRSRADASSLEAAVERAGGNDAFAADQVAIAKRGIRCGGNRARADLTEHDADLESVSLDVLRDTLTRSPYSYNRLSAYAACGFKYLVKNGFGFDEIDPIEPEIDNRLVGTLIHDVLESFFTGLQTEWAEPVDLSAFDREDLERELVDTAETVIANSDHEIESVFDQRLLSILLAGLASPTSNDYYYAIGPRHGPDQGLLARFLETELQAESDYYPTLFEERFGGDDPVRLPDGTELPVGGIIDRVDVDPDTGTAVVFDYKTSHRGRIYSLERHAVGGLDFQLPIYALAAESLLDSVEETIDAAYYMVRPKPELDQFGRLSRRFDDGDYEEFLYEATPHRIEALTEALESGAFHPAVVGPDAAQCEYCSFRDICDVRHHRRHEAIEMMGGEDSVYIPDFAWSDDWDDIHDRLATRTGGGRDD